MDETIIDQEVTRKQFLVIVAVFVFGLLGLSKLFAASSNKRSFEKRTSGFSQGTFGGK